MAGEGKNIINSYQAAKHLVKFMEEFYKVHSVLSTYPLYIFGESYAGHFIPAFANEILSSSKSLTEKLKGVGIGNGWFDAASQESHFYSFAKANDLIFGPNSRRLLSL